MKTKVAVSMDKDLQARAEKILDEPGLSMSTALSMLAQRPVPHQGLPVERVHPIHDVAVAGGAGPELQAEILLELMSTVTARLARMQEDASDPAERARIAKVREALLEKRFGFDPHDGAQINALMQEFSAHASALAEEQGQRTVSIRPVAGR